MNVNFSNKNSQLAGSTRKQTSSAYLYHRIETIQLDPILRSILEIIWKRTLSAGRAPTLFLKTSLPCNIEAAKPHLSFAAS